MYKRIRDGLFDPKKIVEFINDKVIDVILFIIFFALILTAPTLFRTLNFDISFDTKSAIIDIFRNEDIEFEIKDGELVPTSTETSYLLESGLFAVAIGDVKPEKAYSVIINFDNESLYINLRGFKVKVLDYIDYEESANLEIFNLTKGRNETWDDVFSLAYKYVDERPFTFIVLPVLFQFITNICAMLIVALIISLGALLRLRDVVKFGKILKLNIYCLAPFVVGALIDSLFGMNLIYIIGVIITFVYSYITQIELVKKVYSHHKEG